MTSASVLKEHNAKRALYGLPLLKWDSRLAAGALAHAKLCKNAYSTAVRCVFTFYFVIFSRTAFSLCFQLSFPFGRSMWSMSSLVVCFSWKITNCAPILPLLSSNSLISSYHPNSLFSQQLPSISPHHHTFSEFSLFSL